jgi:hypothetical protein
MNERTQELAEQCWDERLDGRHFDKEMFVELVRADEREACANVVEEWLHGDWHNQGVVAAAMIRARGEK